MQLALIGSLIASFLICLPSGNAKNKGFVSCLPAGTNLEEIVSSPQVKSASGISSKRVTVRDTLSKLKAHCKKGKLVDGAGREIRFYRLVGCWGNPPEDYQAQLARQSRELQRLRKKYTVVEMGCGEMDPRQIY
jgi:hypothetical protein